MARRRIYTLYYNLTEGTLYDPFNSSRALSAADVVIPRGDTGLIRLYIRERNASNELVAVNLAGTFTWKFGIKDPEVITGTEALVFSDNDQFNQAGDWDADLAAGKVTVRFSANTTTMGTFLATKKAALTEAIAEIEIREDGGDAFTLAQFAVSCRNDVIRGTEGDPAPAGPEYATVAELAAARDFYIKPDGDDLVIVKDDIIYARLVKP